MCLPPPVSQRAVLTIIASSKKIAHNVGVESWRSASAQLHRLQGADPGDVVDVTVTCDGTWSRCGFVAAYLWWRYYRGRQTRYSMWRSWANLARFARRLNIPWAASLRSSWIGWRSTRTPAIRISMVLLQLWKRKGSWFFGRGRWRRTSCSTWWSYPMGMLRLSHG